MKHAQCNHMLRCLHVSGGIRYELPAILIGPREQYILYHRPHPEVIHHTKKKTFLLAQPELVLVGNNKTRHCVSVALNAHNEPVNMYININLPPEPHANGFEWRDLELDIKLTPGIDGRWKPIVVDVDEFERSDLEQEHRLIAVNEINSLLQEIAAERYPFIKREQLLEELNF